MYKVETAICCFDASFLGSRFLHSNQFRSDFDLSDFHKPLEVVYNQVFRMVLGW